MTQAIVKAGDAALEPGEWQALRESAKAVVNSGFLPKSINTPEKAVTLMLAGRELGLGPMQAIRSIHVIDGKPVMSADLMAGLVHKRIPGALLRIVETTGERCVVDAGRPGQEPTRFTFSLDDAKAAGLLGKDNWKKYPRPMLRARCLSEAARAVFPDVLLGVYDPDELGAVTAQDGTIIQLPEPITPTISPYHEADDAKTYPTDDECQAVCDALAEAESMGSMRAALHEFAWTTPESMERWHPAQVKQISKIFNAQKRKFAKVTDEP
jgi:hypothetical protein